MKKKAADKPEIPDVETRIFDYIVEHGAQSQEDMIFRAGFSKDELIAHGPAAAARYAQATHFSNVA